MNQPMILMYNLNNDKGSRLRLLCLKLRIRVKSVSKSEYAEPIGALADMIAPTGAVNDADLDGEMLVFVNFGNNLLNQLLQQMRASHIPGVALKAVLTPTNEKWTSIQLYDELLKEHEAMHYGQPPAHKNQKS